MCDKNQDFEMTSNEIYASINTASSVRPSNKSWKCFGVVVVVAILLNFLLLIGVGAFLYYNQTKMSSEFNQLSESISSVPTINMSGSPGSPGISIMI